MTEKQNCWEFKQCGREPGGAKVDELGVCPAATSALFDGLNGGHNGGRICWACAGTFCGGRVQGTFAEKRLSCLTCEFMQSVRNQEGTGFRVLPHGGSYRPAAGATPRIRTVTI